MRVPRVSGAEERSSPLYWILSLLYLVIGLAGCKAMPPPDRVEAQALEPLRALPVESSSRSYPSYVPLDYEEGGEVWEIVGLVKEGGWVIVRWGRATKNVDIGTEVFYVNSAGERVAMGAVLEKLGARLDAGAIHEPDQVVSVGDRVFLLHSK